MAKFILSRIHSFQHAFSGSGYVFRTQRNIWIHALISLMVILLAFWLNISLLDWALIILAMTIVWTAEFLNTALEALIDLVSPQVHPLAKVGKDVGAAAVLVAAFGSALVGILVLGPLLWEKVHFWILNIGSY